MKKNLAIFAEGDLRYFGGAEKYVIELSKRLKNFDITIFSPKTNKDIRLEESKIKEVLKADLEFFKTVNMPIVKEKMPLSFSGLSALAKLNKFDVIYIVDPDTPILFMILLSLKFTRKKVKVIFCGQDPAFFRFLKARPQKNTPARRVLLKLYRPIQKAVLFKMPNIHVINTFDLRRLKELGYKGKIYYIPNFLYYDINQIKIKQNKKEFIVLFGGRLSVYHKGIDILIKIIEETIKKNKNIKFHIFGSGEDGQELIEKLSKKYPSNVKYLGFLPNLGLTPNSQIENEYANASLFILTSRFESFSLVTLEAQAHGLPVIAFDIKGPHDIIKKDFQGKLIEPFKIEDFVEAILYYYRLWKADKLTESYKKRIINYIFSKYSDKKIIPKIERMLKS